MEKFLLNQKKFWKGRGNVENEVYDKEGLFFVCFCYNLEMTAKFFSVNKHIIKYRLNIGKSFYYLSLLERKKFTLKDL